MLGQRTKARKEVKSPCKAQGLHLLKLQPQRCGGEAKSITLGKPQSVSCEYRSRIGILNYKVQDSTHSNGKEVAPQHLMGAQPPAKLRGETPHVHYIKSHSFRLIRLGDQELGAQKNPMEINELSEKRNALYC